MEPLQEQAGVSALSVAVRAVRCSRTTCQEVLTVLWHHSSESYSEGRAHGPERVAGIGPALSPWEGDVLPLNYTRVMSCHPGARYALAITLAFEPRSEAYLRKALT